MEHDPLLALAAAASSLDDVQGSSAPRARPPSRTGIKMVLMLVLELELVPPVLVLVLLLAVSGLLLLLLWML